MDGSLEIPVHNSNFTAAPPIFVSIASICGRGYHVCIQLYKLFFVDCQLMNMSARKPLRGASQATKGTGDSSLTKVAVLMAATKLFAARGYTGTGIRDIAALANVNLGLVGRYFGTKEELFALALHEALDINPLLTPDRSNLGRHVAQLFFSYDENELPNPLTMITLSASDPSVGNISVSVLRKRVIAPLADYLGEPDSVARAVQLVILWNGFFAGWKLLRINKMPGSDEAATQAWLAAATQSIVDRPK